MTSQGGQEGGVLLKMRVDDVPRSYVKVEFHQNLEIRHVGGCHGVGTVRAHSRAVLTQLSLHSVPCGKEQHGNEWNETT